MTIINLTTNKKVTSINDKAEAGVYRIGKKRFIKIVIEKDNIFKRIFKRL